jgi:hypothetical protein
MPQDKVNRREFLDKKAKFYERLELGDSQAWWVGSTEDSIASIAISLKRIADYLGDVDNTIKREIAMERHYDEQPG